MKLINKWLVKSKQCDLYIVRFSLFRSVSTCNGNGTDSIVLDIYYGKRKKQFILNRIILGNGDDGNRCEG